MPQLGRNSLTWSALCLAASACAPQVSNDEASDLLEEGGVFDQELSTTASALMDTCRVSDTVTNRSLVVTDPTALSKFNFVRVFERIRSTAGVPNQTNAELFRTWMRTFDVGAGGCDSRRIDGEGYGIECPRSAEAKLAQVNPFHPDDKAKVKFLPVGLFNRFDLAPANGATCGEHRIVYAMQSSDQNISGRGFVIFEGVLPNPNPSRGINGCLPVARFWQSLSRNNNSASRADKLEKFYFTGGAIAGFQPVVRAQAYGLATGVGQPLGAGQIRTNFFVDFAEWHLREFKLRRLCTNFHDQSTCRLAVEHQTVKTNPAEELFAGTHWRSGDFATSFVRQVSRLASRGLNQIGMTTDAVHNEFESVAQRSDVNYELFASSSLKSQVQDQLGTIRSTLTPDDIFRRATTQTCAGCHELSNGAALGGGKTWPNSLGFVHINEAGALSPALTSTFLPQRRAVLEHFINVRCPTAAPAGRSAQAPVDGSVTVGGSPIGAPN